MLLVVLTCGLIFKLLIIMSLSWFFSIPLGVRYIVMSALGFSLMTALVKLVSVYDMPLMEIVAARSLVSFLISYVDVKRKGISIWGTHKKLLLARGTMGSIALICVYYSVSTLPLAEATILQYLHPVFTALLALLFLKERIQGSTIVCIFLCLLGLVLMVGPSLLDTAHSELPLLSVGAAITGALSSAIAYVIVKRLSGSEDSSVIIFYFPLLALPLSVALLGNDFVMPDGQALILLVFIGVFTQIGQVGLTKAMRSEVANKVAAYSYIQVVFSIGFGLVIFGELPPMWTWIGGTLIIVGALVNILGSAKPKVVARG